MRDKARTCLKIVAEKYLKNRLMIPFLSHNIYNKHLTSKQTYELDKLQKIG